MFSILGTSFCGTILIWNYLHWIRDHSENTIDRVEAFLFSPANPCPCHQVTSCHGILHHIMLYYVMYQTCIQILSSVKGQFSWFLPMAWIHLPVGGSKRIGPLLVINIFGTTRGGGGERYFSGISLSYLPVPI